MGRKEDFFLFNILYDNNLLKNVNFPSNGEKRRFSSGKKFTFFKNLRDFLRIEQRRAFQKRNEGNIRRKGEKEKERRRGQEFTGKKTLHRFGWNGDAIEIELIDTEVTSRDEGFVFGEFDIARPT